MGGSNKTHLPVNACSSGMHNPTNLRTYTHAFYIAACNGRRVTLTMELLRSRLYCSYLQRRLLAAIDRCCSVPAPWRLVRTVSSFVQTAACSLSSLLASSSSSSFAPVNVYYSCTAQVEVLKVAATTCMRSQICDLSSIDTGNEPTCMGVGGSI